MKNESKKKLSVREGILIGCNFLWMVIVYYACVIVGEREGIIFPYQLCTGIYAAAAMILVAISAVMSGKYVSKKMGETRSPAQKEIGRKLILWALPLIAVLLIDIIDLFVVEYIKQLLSVAK